MKSIFPAICLFFWLQNATAQVSTHGQLQVRGTQLVNGNAEPVVLRGLSLGWHNWWPRFYNPSTINWLANDWECSVVRAAIGVEPDKAYLQNKAFAYEKLKAVIEAAIANNIYVIVDWHAHNIHTSEAQDFFEKVARDYGKHPNIIYEIFNEPEKATWPEIKAYSGKIVSAIRRIDPDNIILLGTPRWDQEIQVAADSPLKGYSNLMYTVHFYASSHTSWLRKRCRYALNKNLPIFISECAGMEASGDGKINQREWKRWIKFAEKRQMSWIAWSVADKNETCSMLYPSASSEGNWKLSDISPWGIQVRELLRKLN